MVSSPHTVIADFSLYSTTKPIYKPEIQVPKGLHESEQVSPEMEHDDHKTCQMMLRKSQQDSLFDFRSIDTWFSNSQPNILLKY